jgi:hypothetical protein
MLNEQEYTLWRSAWSEWRKQITEMDGDKC